MGNGCATFSSELLFFFYLKLLVVFFNDSHYFLNPIIIDFYLFGIRLEIHYHFCDFIYALPFLFYRSFS